MANTDHVCNVIDELTAPGEMSKQEALEFLQELSGDLVGRIEALQNEIEEEEES
jgi:polyhydroxyalkanoate synthesis regulator phasin